MPDGEERRWRRRARGRAKRGRGGGKEQDTERRSSSRWTGAPLSP